MADYSWLKQQKNVSTVDPLGSSYFGTGDFGDSGSSATPGGAGQGNGFYTWEGSGLDSSSFRNPGQAGGDNQEMPSINAKALSDFLKSNGYTMMESSPGANGGKGYRWVQDAKGNIVGKPQEFNNKDGAFTAGMLAAGALAGGMAAGIGATAGGGAAATTGGTASSGALAAGEYGALTGAAAEGASAGLVGVEGALTAAPGSGLFGAGTGAAAVGNAIPSAGEYGPLSGNSPLTSGAGSPLTSGAGSTGFDWNSTVDWLTTNGKELVTNGLSFKNPLLTDLMKLIGYGVMQASAENATDEQREWLEKQEADKRRRQKPVKTPGMFFTATRGTNG